MTAQNPRKHVYKVFQTSDTHPEVLFGMSLDVLGVFYINNRNKQNSRRPHKTLVNTSIKCSKHREDVR